MLQAREYLAASGWDMETAVTEFFTEQDEALQQDMNTGGGRRLGAEESPQNTARGGTLGEAAVPSSSAAPESSSSAARAAPKKKFATLGDFASPGTAGRNSSDEDDAVDQDFFAGGEKSGLAVQNPDDLKKKILEKARR